MNNEKCEQSSLCFDCQLPLSLSWLFEGSWEVWVGKPRRQHPPQHTVTVPQPSQPWRRRLTVSQALLVCCNYNINNFSEHAKPKPFKKSMDSVTLEISTSFDQYREPLCYLSHRKTLLCRTINPAWNSLYWKKRKFAWWKTKANQKPSEDSWH